jgi:hypothetical protein
MQRVLLVAAIAVASLFALGAVAQAQPPESDDVLPPTLVPPAPAPVVDEASAEAAAERYAARNAARFLNRSARRTRTIDVNAACLEHPVIADRFGCVFTLRALVWQRRGDRGHDGPKAEPTSRSRDRRRRVRIRTYGCLGALSITGGPTATPAITLRFVECARVPRRDLVAPEPV